MEIGDEVLVLVRNGETLFDGLNTCGLSGCVAKLDEKAGVCVKLYISTVFSPAFWYPRTYLGVTNKAKPCTLVDIASAYNQSGIGLSRTKISEGMVRSWLVIKTEAQPGQELHTIIEKMEWSELIPLWAGTNATLAAWLEANDKRIRRPRILNSVTVIESNSVVRRSRVGG